MTDTISSLRAERDALKADIGRLLVAYGSRDEFDGIDEAIADALTMRRERDAARAEVESLRKTLAFTGPIHAQRLLRACQSLHKWWKQEYANRCGEYGRFVAAAKERDTLRARVAELEKALADADKPAAQQQPQDGRRRSAAADVRLVRLILEQAMAFLDVQMTVAERKEWALKIQRSIAMLQAHIPQDGTPYLGAFSGGKDSVCIYELARMAEVPVEWHYHFTTIDPPELVKFIQTVYPDVIFDRACFASGAPRGHLLTSRAVKVKGWPQAGGKRSRWCCSEYKEYGGEGRTSIVGVRIEESARRKKTWTQCFMPRLNKDGEETGKILMPIRLWTEKDVKAFMAWRDLSYCSLYDEGFDRIGCVGCPELTPEQREMQFARWPAIEHQWSEMFRRRWELKAGTIDRNGNEWWGSRNFYTWQELYQWWRETAGRISVTRWYRARGQEPKYLEE